MLGYSSLSEGRDPYEGSRRLPPPRIPILHSSNIGSPWSPASTSSQTSSDRSYRNSSVSSAGSHFESDTSYQNSPVYAPQPLVRTTYTDINAHYQTSMGSIRHHDRPTFTPVNYSTANATLPSRARLQDRQPSHAIDEGSSSSEETLGSERANCALKKRRLETPTSDSTDHNQKNKKDEHKEVEKRRRGEHKDLIDDLKMLYPDGLSDFLRGNLNIDALKSHTKDHKESKNSVLTTAIIFLEAVMIVLTRMFKRYSTLSEDYRNLEEKCHRLEIELKQKSRTQLSIASLCLSDDNSDRPSHVALRDCRKRPNSDLISTSEIPWLADVKAEALRIGKKREEVLICKKQGKEGNLAGKKQPSHSIGKVLHTK